MAEGLTRRGIRGRSRKGGRRKEWESEGITQKRKDAKGDLDGLGRDAEMVTWRGRGGAETQREGALLLKRQFERLLVTPFDLVALRDDFEVVGVFNPGAILVDGEVVLLVRVAERPREKRADLWRCRDGRRESGLKLTGFLTVRLKSSTPALSGDGPMDSCG